MRFLLDMGISPRVGRFLESKGHVSEHLSELGLHRLDDDEILIKASTEGSILLTNDLDFGDLLAASGASLPSVVTFRLADMRPENVSRYMAWVLDHHQEQLESGTIVSVTEKRARLRPPPLTSQEPASEPL